MKGWRIRYGNKGIDIQALFYLNKEEMLLRKVKIILLVK